MFRRFKKTLSEVDKKLDSGITRYVKTTEKIIEEEKKPSRRKQLKGFLKGLDVIGDKIATRVRKIPKIDYLKITTEKPLLTLIVAGIIALILTYPALDVMGHIQSDIEVYLPPGEPSVDILNEIREYWPTDIIIITVSVDKTRDITDLPILHEMSSIEENLDYNKTDYGKDDSVFYVLSISTIIKELNQTVFKGDYSIPDQERTSLILSQISGSNETKRLLRDTDGDGKNDSAVILAGIPKKVDQAQIITKANDIVKSAKLASFTVTGQPAILQAMQKRTYTEFIKILPLMFVLLTLTLFFFHRTLKLVVIALAPMMCSIGITFGFLGLVKDYVVIAPQIVLVAPLLVAFAIGDSIYIANTFAERKEADERERVVRSVKFVFTAILLTSITTTLGFISLMLGALKPIFTIGLVLAIGILFGWIMTITMVPCLVLVLKYKKRYELKGWRGIGKIPVRHVKKIVGIALLVLIISLAVYLPAIKTSADYYLMAPQDEPSVIQQQEYSRKFGSGQPGMVLVRARADEVNTLERIDDIQNMTQLKASEVTTLSIVSFMKMVKLNRTTVYEFIDINQLIGIISESLPGFINQSMYLQNISAMIEEYIVNTLTEERTYWWLISEAPLISESTRSQEFLIKQFYDSLSVEMKSVLINEDYTKTLIMVDMPVMDIPRTRATVTKVNKIVSDYGTIEGGSITGLAGMASILVAINDYVILNQLETMAVAFILMFICLSILFKSIKFAAITLIPVFFVVAYEPLAFVGSNVELSLITMMIASIVIGVGVDFGIHLTHQVRQRGMTTEGVEQSTEAAGISFFEAVITEIVALSAAYVMPIASVRGFITMIIILLLGCMVTALLVLPAVYTAWIKEKTKRVVIE